MSTDYRPAEVMRKLRRGGARENVQKAVRLAYRRLNVSELDFPLSADDIADSSTLSLGEPLSRDRNSGPLNIGWLTSPPSAGSGGHTTMFRMIEELEQAGHNCVLYLSARHRFDLAERTGIIRRSWPLIKAEVRDVDDGLAGIDGCVATGWETAHVLASRTTLPIHRFYFIQDFEPFFYARGSQYELAADTYRFGFTNIALGNMVRECLRTELGVSSALVPFSCDTSVYTLTNTGARSGVVFYAKPGVARRGYLLGALALKRFHETHPDQEIHIYGDPVPEIGFPVTRHGRLTPEALNRLYNSTIAGLAMSFTNISLVAEELLSAGTIPVVNDSAEARADLDNPYVAWASPTPDGIAQALSSVVENAVLASTSEKAAASVRSDNWHLTGSALQRIIEGQIYRA